LKKPQHLNFVSAPNSLKEQAYSGNLPNGTKGTHNDGCGVAWLDGETICLDKRGPDTVWDSYFENRINSLATTALIAHNRRATRGLPKGEEISHPYQMQCHSESIAFCHNGGIKSFMEEANDTYMADSRVFVNRLTKDIASLTLNSLKDFLASAADTWDYTSINALLLTKNSIFAWRCYQSNDNNREKRDAYFSLYLRASPGQACITSEPIDNETDWEPLKNRTLLELRQSDGRIEIERVTF
jgi:predicted glutamine amidotransferase